MTKVKNLADLEKLRDGLKIKASLQSGKDNQTKKIIVKVAMATCAIASGARETKDFFSEALIKRNIDGEVIQTGCMGYCYAEPTIEVTIPGADPVVIGFVDTNKADQIIERYIKNGELVDDIIPVNYQKIDD